MYLFLTDTKLWLVVEDEHPVATCLICLERRALGRSVINISSSILALVSSYNWTECSLVVYGRSRRAIGDLGLVPGMASTFVHVHNILRLETVIDLKAIIPFLSTFDVRLLWLPRHLGPFPPCFFYSQVLAINAFSLHASAIKLKKCKPSASRKRDRIFQHDDRYMRCRCIIWLGIRHEILPWICGLNLISSTISLMLGTSASSRCKKISYYIIAYRRVLHEAEKDVFTANVLSSQSYN